MSCRARRRSVPSSNTIVTAESPKRDTLRISSTPGRPLIEASTGNVMVRSTSTGPSAGTFVSTCTWTLVMSGTASMGSCCALRTPTAATMTTKAKTRRRHFRQSSRSFFMACPSVLVAFGELAAAQRALQREGAADGEARTLIQARSHLEEAACATAERDRLRAEAVRFVGGDEHHRLAIEGRHRVGRDNEHALVRASADQLDAPEETAAKTG